MGVEARIDDVVLCAGAQHGLFVVLSHLASRARAIYVEELTYPGIHGIAEILRLPLVAVGMDADGIDVESLARVARRHGPGVVFCMPTIHNPTGTVMPASRRAALAEVAREKGLFVVEDAANRMLEPSAPPPMRSFAPERTFLVASVSKVLSPGLRVAFLVGPDDEVHAVTRRVWATHWMSGPLGAEIVATWLDEGVVDRTLASKRRAAARRQAIARRVLGAERVVAHPRALHVWLRLGDAWSTERFTADAARRRIVVTPSSAFWARPTPPPRAIRISLGGLDDARALTRELESLAALSRAR
jgi:DNA-binding transcriptional MocR family regulator